MTGLAARRCRPKRASHFGRGCSGGLKLTPASLKVAAQSRLYALKAEALVPPKLRLTIYCLYNTLKRMFRFPGGSEAPETGHGMRILIAEGDPHFRRMLEHMLVSWQYDAIAATNRPEILALLKTDDAPDVALLDSAMAASDGFQLCRKIRESAGPLTGTYLIMLLRRSITVRDVFAASLDAGADDYICKPFDPEELRARLRVGAQVIALRRSLSARESELEATTVRIRELQELLLERASAGETAHTAMSAQASMAVR